MELIEKILQSPVFPVPDQATGRGMSFRCYLMAHAPTEIPPWFQPDYSQIEDTQLSGSMLKDAHEFRYFQWRVYYAEQIIKYL